MKYKKFFLSIFFLTVHFSYAGPDKIQKTHISNELTDYVERRNAENERRKLRTLVVASWIAIPLMNIVAQGLLTFVGKR